MLANTPDLTLFAPTDAAFALFARANPEGFETLARNGELLISVLQYHVAARRRLAAELVGLDGLEMLTGESVSLAVAGGSLEVNGISVADADILASNGVIHTLGGVLLPEANCVDVADCLEGAECREGLCVQPEPPASIIDRLREAGNFTILLRALEVAELIDALNAGDGPFTLFAPNDDAMNALEAANPGILETLLGDASALRDVLLHHVVADGLGSEDVLASENLVSALGTNLAVVADEAGATIGGAPIIAVDIEAVNGVVHVLGGVMLPPPRVDAGSCAEATPIRGAGQWLGQTRDGQSAQGASCGGGARGREAVFEWSGVGDFCVLTAGSGYDTVLHAREGECGDPGAEIVCNDDNPDGGLQSRIDVRGEEGETYFFFVDGFGNASGDFILTVRQGPCVEPAPPGNLAEVLAADGRFGILLQLVEAAGLVNALTEAEWTVFAPTDDVLTAFQRDNPGVVEALLANPEQLANILLYHLVSGTVLSTDLANDVNVPTALADNALFVRLNDGGAFVNYSTITEVDNRASNGVFT